MLGEHTNLCKQIVHSTGGFVALVAIWDAYVVPEAPETCFSAHNGRHWCLNNAHWLTIPHGQDHNVVAFLRLEFAIGDCKGSTSKGTA